jgi:hypothetical protein
MTSNPLWIGSDQALGRDVSDDWPDELRNVDEQQWEACRGRMPKQPDQGNVITEAESGDQEAPI